MNNSIRSKIAIPAALLLATALVVMLASCGQRSSGTAIGPEVPGDNVQVTRAPLEAWRVPVTADPVEYAAAFGRAIWTYDVSKHSYSDWEHAVSLFADAGGTSGAVARSMLPIQGEWRQLALQKAQASAAKITARTTPELDKLRGDHQLPQGWQAYVVRGHQTVVLATETKTIERVVAVSIVCVYTCKFWSASAQPAA